MAALILCCVFNLYQSKACQTCIQRHNGNALSQSLQTTARKNPIGFFRKKSIGFFRFLRFLGFKSF